MKSKPKKCLRCRYVPCINLFRSLGKLEGGELFILNQIIKEGKLFPCIVGAPIFTLCKFTDILASHNKTKNLPLTLILRQVVRDVKCSVFLVLCGHYRNAMQVLRPVIENFLAGLYFTGCENTEAFEKWVRGKYFISTSLWKEIKGKEVKKKTKLDYKFCLEYITKKIIHPNPDLSVHKWWGKRKKTIEQKVIPLLNNYLHPHFPSYEIATPGKCSTCPVTVKYNERELKKWLETYQKILFFILEFLIIEFGELLLSNEESKNALLFLLEPPEVKKRFLLYPEYRKFVEWVEQFKDYDFDLEKNRESKI